MARQIVVVALVVVALVGYVSAHAETPLGSPASAPSSSSSSGAPTPSAGSPSPSSVLELGETVIADTLSSIAETPGDAPAPSPAAGKKGSSPDIVDYEDNDSS